VSTKHEDPQAVDGSGTGDKRPQDWSVKERMQLVLEADGLADQELGELLRRRGVHRKQLDEWRAAVEEAFSAPTGRRSPASKRIKQLEREVARKDKALAETAALLVLQKKVQLLFPDGVHGDDDTDEESDK
jgi:transposase